MDQTLAVWKSFPFLCYLLKFLFQLLGVQNGSRVCIFCQGKISFEECQFAFLVQFFGLRVCFFLLQMAIILKVEMVFYQFAYEQ